MKRAFPVCVALFSLVPLLALAQAPRGYYRFPAIHGDTVVFTAEGDLWKVGIAGGVAQRLTTHAGQETHAAISPDGSSVAFSAEYEGPTEVYLMPLAGGLPTRLTYEGGHAAVVGWTPDGKVLYAATTFSTLPEVQLATVDPRTGARSPVPLSQASDGAYDQGGTLFFTRLPFQGSHTKRYRGGMAQQIWKLEAGAREALPMTADYPGTSKTPMVWRGRVYFASDRDGTMNLWSMDENGADLRQLTRNEGWDAAFPSLSDGRIVYQLGADLRLFDIASGRDAVLAVALVSDLDQLREKWLAKPIDYLTTAGISPDGDRVALTARGQVFVAPAKQGRFVEAARAPGVRYRQAYFLSDGKSLVALSDESGEVEWWRLPANGVGKPERLTHDGTVLRFDGVPSPDGTMIAYDDKDLVLWIYDIPEKRTLKVATSPRGGFGGMAWSPDSRWLAYTVPAANTFSTIRLYHVDDRATVPLTGDRTNSGAPAWTPDGKWIYFLSDRNLQSVVPGPWGAYQPEPFFASPTRLYAAALAAGERFPFQPADELHPEKSEEGKKADDRKADAAKAATKPEGRTPAAEKPKVSVVVDAKGLQERLFEVPVPPGDYGSLSTNGQRLFWLSRTASQPGKATLEALDVSNKEPKPKSIVADVKEFELSADGKKLMVRKGDDLAVLDASAGEKADFAEKKVDLSSWKLAIDPREEWHQMFVEAWRLERDYFYDRHMNGANWPAVLKKYLPLVGRVTDRAELSDLLGQMVSELSALHIFVYGGDVREGREQIVPASLGAELARDEAAGGYRVAHVYRADPDYPDALSPLARPDVDVRDGDVIEAINGVATLSVAHPSTLLRDQAGRQVLLHVKRASGGARDVIVTPISPDREAGLRYAEWELTRRQRVEELGDGQIGYVHLRAMGARNYTEWAQGFYPVYDRAGLIVDVRHNRGGNIDSWILEKLLRKAWFYWQPRIGQPYWNMQYAFRGPVVVMVDQRTASDGEAFAEGFRRLGLGKVIGMRTWGGEIWLSSSNFLVDKGIATAAETGVYGPEGEWLIEGRGVQPDIVVDNLPAATFRGGDAQLDAAVRYLQGQIRDHPAPVPPPPAYPDKASKPDHP